MNKKAPRTKPAEQRRHELLDAAEELVLRAGSDAFTVDEVTSGAGVAKGTFYLHFANKAEVLRALRERYLTRFVAAQLAAARRADGVAAVEQWMLVGITEYLRDLRLHDVLFHTTSADRAAPNPAVDTLVDLLSELAKPPADPRSTAVVLYSVMHGAADHIAHAPEDEPALRATVAQVCRTLLAGD
ncbi:TetR/AcrR family transcriptional regulator [Nocardia farcinica]|uniref:TetR/AcrR family transcriptional regulator n=1 Tax=Nocardia farcinica TaxID=37329 RepID=UPI001B3C6D0E|nr:TetR/AcrR family transcriptional regulator [Nocardia farcinica]MBF6537347.1 TetR/AcrR family transcriptional regulator [Nocardia farcinica]